MVALHPDYSFSYAPARVIGTQDNWFFDLKFYDQSEVSTDNWFFDLKFYHQSEVSTDNWFFDLKFYDQSEISIDQSPVIYRLFCGGEI